MIQDLRFACRQIAKTPGFAAIAVLTLALGIGANTTIFSVVEAILLSPLPYPDSTRIVQVWHAPTPGARNIADGGTFLDWKRHGTSFAALAALHPTEINFAGDDEPAQLNAYAVSAEYLRVLGLAPAQGRDFTAADDAAGGANEVAIVTHEMWQQRLQGDPAVVGRVLRLDGRAYTVVGVLAPDALATPGVELLVPAAIEAHEWKQQRNYNYVCAVVGRLKPGATIAQAQAELAAAAASLQSLYPPNKAGWTVTVDSLHESVARGPRPYLVVLLVTVGVVLLIACANVANLLLARAATRQTEIAVRVALGASRAHVIRLVLAESILLALLGGVGGLFLAAFALDPLVAFTVGQQTSVPITINGPVLGFTLLVSLGTGVLFGLAPALRVARPDLTRDLKESSRGTAGGSRHRLQRVFIVGETALTAVLLFTAGLLLRSFVAALGSDAGMERDNILLFDLTRTSAAAPTPAHRVRFIEDVLRETAAVPGVARVGMISSAPFNNQRFYGDTIRRAESVDARDDVRTGFDGVAGDLFPALGTPLLRGRLLAPADNAPEAARVVLVNRALAQRLFGEADALGRQVRFKDAVWEIVGVVGDTRRAQLDAPPPPMVYLPSSHFPWTISIVVRTQASPLALVEAVRRAVRQVDPDQPIANLRTMEQAIEASFTLRTRRVMLTLLAGFAAIALVLACIGLYGVMSYAVANRTREIGVRIALGASAETVHRDIVRSGLLLVLAGVAIGAVASTAAGFGISSQLYGVGLADPAYVFAAVAAVLLGVATAACWVPARRATRINPIEALRAE